jgi:predicted component of type VI protein secretion system
MMVIRVVSRAGQPLAVPLSAPFPDTGGDIGRGDDCTLVLPDPERRISRKHALVTRRGGQHYIRQLGAHMPVEVDGVALGPDVERSLAPGSEIRIGPYLLRTVAAAEDDENAPLATVGPVPAPPPPVMPSPSPVSRPSVFSDLLGPAPEPAQPTPVAVHVHEIDLVLGDPEPPAPASPLQPLYAGLGMAMPAAPTEAQLKLIGSLLRTSIAGTLELLAARNIAKRELGAGQTLLQTRENNPLKFSPDADVALAHLLGPAQRGFIAPRAALQDAFDALRAHEMAMLAGMRAALDAVLARFDPQALEQRLTPKGSWALMHGNRKARLWEGYAELYAQILREIEGDFDPLFGRAFLEAYEAQLAQVTREKREPPD